MFHQELTSHLACFEALALLEKKITSIGAHLVSHITDGHKILICGNGGSAADAQHFAAEVVCRLEENRSARAALALTTDTSILTAVANDFGFDSIFSRQVKALAQPGDILIGLSTSGRSGNIIAALDTAREQGLITVGLTGHTGGHLKDAADHTIIVPAANTQRIQEAHIFILHCWAKQIEQAIVISDG
jgi:D-sedoheptulose 7-phosphate isomerase